MAPKHKALFCIIHRDSQVKASVNKLGSFGFLDSDINVLRTCVSEQSDIERLQKTMILAFAKVGSLIGAATFLFFGFAIIGGIFDFGFSIDDTFLTQAFVVLFALFFGILFGAASGALVGIGTPQNTLLRYGNYIDAGGALMSVRVGNVYEESRVKKCLESSGARDITLLNEEQVWNSVHKNQMSKPNF